VWPASCGLVQTYPGFWVLGLTNTAWKRQAAAWVAGVKRSGEPSTDFTRSIALRLRDEPGLVLDLGAVPSAAVWFEVINHSDVDLVLDRIVLELRVGQTVLHDVMGHRYPVPKHETVSSIYYLGRLTEGAAALIRKHQEAARAQGGPVQTIHVYARAYFDSPTWRFAIDSRNISRPLPSI
jgi:hypothetical protein